MSFPKTALRRYKALSMIMVLNWMSSITRKASGTWSSDRVEAMSAAALCFWRRNTQGIYFINWPCKLQQVCWVDLWISHPKSPKAKDNDDEVDDISQEHECIDISGSPILSMENTPEEPLSWPVNTLDTAEQTRWHTLKPCIHGKINHILVVQCFL